MVILVLFLGYKIVEMSDHDEEHFEQADSGASNTFPKQCSALRKNEHVMIKGRPCKVINTFGRCPI